VDLDGDGWLDIISGSCGGALFIFRGRGAGQFGPREEIRDRNGNPLTIGIASTVFAADWRGTGKLDLFVGTSLGHVYVVPNEGKGKECAFGRPYRLAADGREIQIPSGYSHPVVADWDRDGKLDLLVGSRAGSVLWYRNIGTNSEPRLAAPRTLIPESPQAQDDDPLGPNQWGTWSKICVTDWNGDGWPDLLVGDYTRLHGVKPKQTEAEKIAEANARRRLTTARKERAALKQLIQLLGKPSPPEMPQARKDRETGLQDAQGHLSDLVIEIEELEETIGAYRSHKIYHDGFIWLFLRKPPQDAAKANP
jgi:hypothetical protein